MIPVQPVNIFSYLGSTKNSCHSDVSNTFYLSWEDGLWDIIRSFNIKKGSVILVPSFFCDDVIQNMRSHGLTAEYYAVDDDLQPDSDSIAHLIKKKKPAFLVLFHAVGIQNQCVTEAFISKLPKNLIIIEDSVHRIVQHSQVRIFHDRHICMTSIRKVVPLQGSFMYGRPGFIQKLRGPNQTAFFYSMGVIGWWFLMQLSLHLQYSGRYAIIPSRWGKAAEYCMLKGYDLIGDSNQPGWCPRFFSYIYSYIDKEKIKKIKSEQTGLYQKLLGSGLWSIPKIDKKSRGELRGFPLIFYDKKEASRFINAVRSVGIMTRAELEGCLWTAEKTIIYLPMGPYINKRHILHICAVCTVYRSDQGEDVVAPTFSFGGAI